MEIKLWYSNGAKFKTECYFWCTRDGSVPSRKPQNFDVSELLFGEFRVSPIKMGTNDSQPLDISPLTVYFTNQGCVSYIMSFVASPLFLHILCFPQRSQQIYLVHLRLDLVEVQVPSICQRK